jgi:hypothetical protein
VLKAHNLLDVLDLLILHDLVVLRLAHVEKLAAQREDAKVITSDNTEPGYGERLGGVSFGQYECASGCVACPSIVCVRKLRDTSKATDDEKKLRCAEKTDARCSPVALATIRLLDLLVGPEFCPVQHVLHNGGLGH